MSRLPRYVDVTSFSVTMLIDIAMSHEDVVRYLSYHYLRLSHADALPMLECLMLLASRAVPLSMNTRANQRVRDSARAAASARAHARYAKYMIESAREIERQCERHYFDDTLHYAIVVYVTV